MSSPTRRDTEEAAASTSAAGASTAASAPGTSASTSGNVRQDPGYKTSTAAAAAASARAAELFLAPPPSFPTLSPEEEAYQEGLLEIFKEELEREVAADYPDNARRQELTVNNFMALARRRIPKRQAAEGLYWSLQAKLERFSTSVALVISDVSDDGELTANAKATGAFYLQKWREELKPKLEDVKSRLDGSYYGYKKANDHLLANLDAESDAIFKILGPLTSVLSGTAPTVALPASSSWHSVAPLSSSLRASLRAPTMGTTSR